SRTRPAASDAATGSWRARIPSVPCTDGTVTPRASPAQKTPDGTTTSTDTRRSPPGTATVAAGYGGTTGTGGPAGGTRSEPPTVAAPTLRATWAFVTRARPKVIRRGPARRQTR